MSLSTTWRGALAPVLLLLAPALAGQQPLTQFDGPVAAGGLGGALALLGDLDDDGVAELLVGAPDDDQAGTGAGAVRVLSGADGSVLFERLGFAAGDQLGGSVAAAGDVDGDGVGDVLVGAPQDSSPNDTGWHGAGPGYALVLSGADFSLLHAFQGDHGRTIGFGSFGRRVAGAGDLDGDGHADLAVAERDRDIELPDDHDQVGGRVWIYSGADGSVLRRIEALVPPYGHLGWGLAAGRDLDGDAVPDLVLGSPLNKTWVAVSGATGGALYSVGGGPTFQGQDALFLEDLDDDGTVDVAVGARDSVQLFSGADGTPLAGALSVPGASAYDGPRLAAAPDADGDGVGDLVASHPDAGGLGQVRLFSGATGALIGLIKGGVPGMQLGAAALGLPDQDGDGLADLLIGAPGADGPAGAGAGLVGTWSSRGPRQVLAVYSPNPVDGNFGQRVASAGDVDNDGRGDLIVGLPDSPNAFFVGGRVQVFSGGDGSLLHDFDPPGPYYRMGWAVDGVGDVDGDGFEDLAMGGPFPPISEGAPFVQLRSGRDGSLLQHLTGPLGSQYGFALAGVGDLDGDGRGDLVVSAPNDSSTTSAVGTVRAVSGASGALLWLHEGVFAFSGFGEALGAAGDVDADGTPDVVIGARSASVNGGGSGLVRVVSGVDGSLLHDFPGSMAVASAGWSVTGLGDVDGDGHADVAYGEPGVPSPQGGSGVIVVRSGATGDVLHTLGSTAADGSFGRTLADAGDIDGDGVHELAVGLPAASDAASAGGAVRFYSGATGALVSSWVSAVAGGNAGEVVSSFGDVDGDGTVDVMVGALNSPEHPAPAGAVYVVNPLPAITSWSALGGALTGGAGVPRLVGGGTLTDGSPTTLALRDALPGTVSALVFGTFDLSLPFKGGVLVPDPLLIFYGLPTGSEGELTIGSPWPAGVPSGFALYAQHWISDAAGPVGFAASNAVVGVVP